MPTVKELVSNGQLVFFKYYRDNALWYGTESGFTFPVPISDTGTATFNNQDKAIFFMRWIRKHLAELEQEAKEVEAQK